MRYRELRLNKSILHIFIEFLCARTCASYCRQNKISQKHIASRSQKKCLEKDDKAMMYKV